jgi:hypothetical protein
MKKSQQQKPPDVIGWREHVGLPDLGVPLLRAKIDTGARTSALHAVDVVPFERAGAPWVSFAVPLQDSATATVRFAAPVHDRRAVKNTSGVPEDRWIIRTILLLGRRRWHIQLSLANRENMGFDLILGRTAIRGRRVFVNAGRSFLAGEPINQPTDAACVDQSSPIITLRDNHSDIAEQRRLANEESYT